MALKADLDTSKAGIAKITLDGELDASTAPVFKEAVEKAAASKPQYLTLEMSKLDFMASAGLRVLIFAKQKMGTSVDIYVVDAQDNIKDTLKKTGYDQSVNVVTLDEYNKQVEAKV